MSNAEITDLTDVLDRVKTWPTTLRITLARKILESLDKAETTVASPHSQTRGFSAAEDQGLLKTNRPPADDETVKLLETIETHTVDRPPRKGSLKGLLGILKTDTPPPTDKECRAILEAELIKKHLIDDLQIECASDGRLDAIVTRNPKNFAGSPILVLTPAELLAQLSKALDE